MNQITKLQGTLQEEWDGMEAVTLTFKEKPNQQNYSKTKQWFQDMFPHSNSYLGHGSAGACHARNVKWVYTHTWLNAVMAMDILCGGLRWDHPHNVGDAEEFGEFLHKCKKWKPHKISPVFNYMQFLSVMDHDGDEDKAVFYLENTLEHIQHHHKSGDSMVDAAVELFSPRFPDGLPFNY